MRPPCYNDMSMPGFSAEAITIIRKNNSLPTGHLVDLKTQKQ